MIYFVICYFIGSTTLVDIVLYNRCNLSCSLLLSWPIPLVGILLKLKLLGILISDPKKTAEEMAVEVGVTKRTIERVLVILKKKGLIERIGSNKSGN